MNYRKDKDLGWAIAFTSFLIFLLAAVTFAAVDGAPSGVPQAVALANASLGRAFLSVASSFVRWLAVAGVIFGIVGIITWPPDAG